MRVYVNSQRGGWVMAWILTLISVGVIGFGVGIVGSGNATDGGDVFGVVVMVAIGLFLAGCAAFVFCRLLVSLRRDGDELVLVRPDWMGGTRQRFPSAEVEGITLVPVQFRDFQGGGGDGLSDLIALISAPLKDGHEAGLQLREGKTVRLTHLRYTDAEKAAVEAKRIAAALELPCTAALLGPQRGIHVVGNG